MMRSLLSAAALTASLAGATAALAQSGAQTGALGSGGSTSNQTGAATATTPNAGPGYSQGKPGTAGVPTNPGVPTSAHGNSGPIGSNQQLPRNEIHNVQQHLQQQGYYKNAKVDGRWGPHTQQAVQDFQQAKGLPATGQLDQQTLNALGVNEGG